MNLPISIASVLQQSLGQQSQAQPQQAQPNQGSSVDDSIKKTIESNLKPKSELSPLQINPSLGKTSLGSDIGMGILSMFVPQIGVVLQKHIKQQKEQQVNQVVNDFTILHSAWEEAQQLSGGDTEKAKQMFSQDPRIASLFADKKKIKLLTKAFGVDLMNPEKTMNNVAFQGLKRFMDLKQAKQKIDQAKQGMDSAQQGQQQPQQGQTQPQPNQAQSTQPGQAEARGFIDRWPKQIKQPSMADAHTAAQTQKELVLKSMEGEPKTEFQAWYKSKTKELGHAPSSDEIEAHHDAGRETPIMRLAGEAIEDIQGGDVDGGKQKLQIATDVNQALHPKAQTRYTLEQAALHGDKDAKNILDYDFKREYALKEAIGMGRAKGYAMYQLRNFLFDDGQQVTMSAYQFMTGQQNGAFKDRGVVMINNLTSDQIGTVQRMQSAMGLPGTPMYEHGALKGMYDNLDAFDDTKTRAIFAKALQAAHHDSDVVQWLSNMVDQLSQQKLDDKGLKALAYTNRLREALGTMRKAGYLPSTEASQDLMYRLVPGGGTSSSKQAKIQLDMVADEVKNATEIPLLPHKPKAQTNPSQPQPAQAPQSQPQQKKMSLQDFLNQK
jgi:hypothetical protein